jgi:hypothetical protein
MRFRMLDELTQGECSIGGQIERTGGVSEGNMAYFSIAAPMLLACAIPYATVKEHSLKKKQTPLLKSTTIQPMRLNELLSRFHYRNATGAFGR